MSVTDIRYKKIGYVALTVTDLDRSAAFYRDVVGATVERSSAGDSLLVRVSSQQQDILLVKGNTPSLLRVSWQMESARALDAAREHLATLGLTATVPDSSELASLGISNAFRVVEPTTGLTFEFFETMLTDVEPFVPTHTKIARLGHMVLGSANKEATEKMLIEHLNFRVSDRIGEVITFLRCHPNPYHHSFGVGPAEKSSLNHVNFMVTDIDDIGKALIRLKKNHVIIYNGPGRHPTSTSIFLYFLDPDGIILEYSFGMEEFPEDDARAARDFPVLPESFDEWGGSRGPGAPPVLVA